VYQLEVIFLKFCHPSSLTTVELLWLFEVSKVFVVSPYFKLITSYKILLTLFNDEVYSLSFHHYSSSISSIPNDVL